MKTKILCILFTLFLLIFNSTKAEDIDITAEYGILYDYTNNEILFEKNSRTVSAPSSLTKIMVAYIVFDKLENKEIFLDDKFKVSVRAWRQEGSRMFLEPEMKVLVDELIKGLLVVSGNDSAVALAEGISGSEENFVLLMNNTAKKLGMKNTNFVNATGLYDKKHYSTVEDLTILIGNLLNKHKKYYDRYFAIDRYTFNGISQKNRNVLLGVVEGVDGVKTGNTKEGGFALATSVERKGLRFITIVNGAMSDNDRANDSQKLINYAFSQYKYIDLYKKNEPILYIKDVIKNIKSNMYIYAEEDVVYAIKTKNLSDLKVQIIYDLDFKMIKKGDKIATLRFIEKDKIVDFDLFSSEDMKNLTFISQFLEYFKENCFGITRMK